MKAIKLFCALLTSILFSNFALADSNICQKQFLLSHLYHDPFVASLKIENQIKTSVEHLEKAEKLAEKINILESMHDQVSRLFRNKQAFIRAKAEAFDLPFDKEQKYITEQINKTLKDMLPHFDELTMQAKKLFDSQGISSTIKISDYGNGLQAKYIELGDTALKENRANTKLLRFQKRFGADASTFNFLENIKDSTLGFFNNEYVELGFMDVRNLLQAEDIGMVAKHEFMHAAFAAKRAKGESSLYHARYLATGEIMLVKGNGMYKNFMVAEELYNFANNAFWGSKRLLNPKKYELDRTFRDLISIHDQIESVPMIAENTIEITTSVLKAVGRMRKEIKKGDFDIAFLKADRTLAEKSDEAYHIILFDKEKKHEFAEYAGKEYQELIKILLQKHTIAMAKNASKIIAAQKAGKEALASLRKEVDAEFIRSSEKELNSILDVFEQKQIKLRKVAKAVQSESERVIDFHNDIIAQAQRDLNEYGQKRFLDDDWVEKFKELGARYRQLGNIVKEDYKGFAGR